MLFKKNKYALNKITRLKVLDRESFDVASQKPMLSIQMDVSFTDTAIEQLKPVVEELIIMVDKRFVKKALLDCQCF